MKKWTNKIKNSYNNLMNNTKLGYYLRKTVSPKNTYLLFIVFGSLVLLGSYVSYALFTVAQEKDKAFNIVVGNLVSNIRSDDFDENHTIYVEADSSKMATITIENTNAVKAKYNLNYVVYNDEDQVANDTVEVKYLEVSKDKPNENGQYTIDKASSNNNQKEITVMLTNTSDSDKKVTFDSQVGLSTATLNNNENVKIINKEFKYTYDAYASSLNTTAIPYKEEQVHSKEYQIQYLSNRDENLFVRLSKDTVYMDISETLDSQNVTIDYKSSFSSGQSTGYEIYVEHPQTMYSLEGNSDHTDKIYGQDNLVTIPTIFSFDFQNGSILSEGDFDYNNVDISDGKNTYPFLLVGTVKDQTKTINGQKVTIGFYGYYKKTNKTTGYTHYTYDSNHFSVVDDQGEYQMPGFTLYTYDKTKFKSEIEKYKEKIYNYDPANYDVEEYIEKINKAIALYNTREVTQEQLDAAIEELAKEPDKINLFDYQEFYKNKTTASGSTNDHLVYTLKPNTQYKVTSNVPYQNNKAVFFIKSGGSYTIPYTETEGFGKDHSRTVTTDSNGNLFIAIRNEKADIKPVAIVQFEDGTYWIRLIEVK